MKNLNPNLYPKGGHCFIERDGAKIFGDSWAGVIKRVEAYRKRANIPPGNPKEEVTAQACQRDPVICVEDNGAYQHEVKKVSLKGRVLTWLTALVARMGSEPLEFVSDDVSKERARICASCPKNVPLPEGCASCKAAVAELRRNIIGGRFVDGRLNGCSVTGEDLPVAGWIEQQRLDNGELPPPCWRRRTL